MPPYQSRRLLVEASRTTAAENMLFPFAFLLNQEATSEYKKSPFLCLALCGSNLPTVGAVAIVPGVSYFHWTG